MLKEAPFRLRPSTQSEETAGVYLPVSVSPADPPYPLSGVSAPSPTSHTRTDSGWAWLCPPESGSQGPALTRQAARATVAWSGVDNMGVFLGDPPHAPSAQGPMLAPVWLAIPDLL